MMSSSTGVPARRGGIVLAALGLVLAAGHVNADVLDLTTLGASGTINGVIFEQYMIQPAGSGVIRPIVRMQAEGPGGVQEGYNTSGRPTPFDELSGVHTRDIQLGEIPIINVGGTSYFGFILDVNEPASGENSLISLDDVRIFVSGMGGQTTTNIASLGTLVYSLDNGGDNWIRLDANLSAGSGQSDMRMLVPTALFDGFSSDQFLYLYSRFGENHAAQAGFEEWAVIPLPPSVWIGGGCLAALALSRHVRRRRLDGLV